MAPEVVVVGHLCVDLLPSFPRDAKSPAPGRTAEVGRAQLWPGGAVANVGGALERLGIDAELVGLVGDDPLGDLVRTLLARRSGRSFPGVRVAPGETTSYTLVLSRPGKDRAFLHHPGANDRFHPAEIDPSLLDEGKILHFGYPPFMRRVYRDGGRRFAEWLGAVHEAGFLTSLDLAFPDPDAEAGRADWQGFLERVLPHVDLFIPSLDELAFMLKDLPAHGRTSPLEIPTDLEPLARWALDSGARLFVLKLGPQGLYLRTASEERLPSGRRVELGSRWGSREVWAPAFAVTPAGTTGAGDAAVAGFLAGLLRSFSLEETITLAAAVAACSVEAADSTSGVRPLDETLERIKRGWPHLPVARGDWEEHGPTGVLLGPRDASPSS